MAINLQFGAPLEVAQAGMAAGLGEYQRYREQQALRDQEMALREAVFREQQEQNDFNNQFSQTRLGVDQFNRDRAFQYGVFSDQQQLGLRQQAMQQDAMMQQQALAARAAEAEMARQAQMQSQRAVTDRQRMMIQAQVERDRLLQLERQASADWEAIQKQAATPGGFRPGQYEQAVQRWEELYGAMGQSPRVAALPDARENPNAERIAKSLNKSIDEIPYDPETDTWLVPAPQYYQSVTNENIAKLREENAERRHRETLALKEAELKVDRENKQLTESISHRMEAATINQRAMLAEDKRKKMMREGKSFRDAMISSPPPLITESSIVRYLEIGTIYQGPDMKYYMRGYENRGPLDSSSIGDPVGEEKLTDINLLAQGK